jgi:uncharacterized membrane protein YjjB (DUF3815 family)
MVYVYAFLASLFFAVLYNVRGPLLIVTAFCGALGQMVYDWVGNDSIVAQFLIATLVMAVYSEICARIFKVPVMVILTVGILPIIPGAWVYNTINALLKGEFSVFRAYGLQTLLSMGAMAIGIMIVSSVMQLVKTVRDPVMRLFIEANNNRPHRRF